MESVQLNSLFCIIQAWYSCYSNKIRKVVSGEKGMIKVPKHNSCDVIMAGSDGNCCRFTEILSWPY